MVHNIALEIGKCSFVVNIRRNQRNFLSLASLRYFFEGNLLRYSFQGLLTFEGI